LAANAAASAVQAHFSEEAVWAAACARLEEESATAERGQNDSATVGYQAATMAGDHSAPALYDGTYTSRGPNGNQPTLPPNPMPPAPRKTTSAGA
jgi:hypothetical protein